MGIAIRTTESFGVGEGVNTSIAIQLSSVPLPVLSAKITWGVTNGAGPIYIGDAAVAVNLGVEIQENKTWELKCVPGQWFDLSSVYFYTATDNFDGTTNNLGISYVAKTGR